MNGNGDENEGEGGEERESPGTYGMVIEVGWKTIETG